MPDPILSEQTDSGRVDVIVDGSDTLLQWTAAGHDDTVTLARIEPTSGLVRIFPKTPGAHGMDEQFTQVSELQISMAELPGLDVDQPLGESDRYSEWVFAGLPRRFGNMFWMGLGLPRRYRAFVHLIEEHTPCTVVRFGPPGAEGRDGDVFMVSLARFQEYADAVERNRRRADTAARRVNASEAHNAVADLLGVDPVQPHPGRHPMIQLFTKAVSGEVAMDAQDRTLLVESVRAASPRIASEDPVAFTKLRDDIELVSLDTLIERYRHNLGGRAKSEPTWQLFFENNSFALQQLFAAPVALYGSQLQVRYPNLHRRGGRVADFVLVNTVTRSVYIVELKTPGAELIGKVYRGIDGAEVYLPGKDLAGGVAQVQSQVEAARLEMREIIERTPGAEDVDTLDVRGAVIVGRISELDEGGADTFRRFRTGLRDIEVLTFDELLDRLAGLRDFLNTEAAEPEELNREAHQAGG